MKRVWSAKRKTFIKVEESPLHINTPQASAPEKSGSSEKAAPKSKLAGISQKRLAKYFEYLDAIRESGITNMYGASPYLSDAFKLDRNKSVSVLTAWMKSFSTEPAMDRAAKALEAAT